jgi:hypothetical protein
MDARPSPLLAFGFCGIWLSRFASRKHVPHFLNLVFFKELGGRPQLNKIPGTSGTGTWYI